MIAELAFLLALAPPDPLCIILLECPIPTVITIPSPPALPTTPQITTPTTQTTGAATSTSSSTTSTSTGLPPEVTAELSAVLDELLVIFDI